MIRLFLLEEFEIGVEESKIYNITVCENDRKEYILSARLDDDTIPANPEP
jgi:hypothetical protein